MGNVLKYKEYLGSINYSKEETLFFGKIRGINDLVTYEGESKEELEMAFKEAVEDYLKSMEKLRK